MGEIVWLLSTIDEISVSVRTLRRILRCIVLYSRSDESDTTDVALFLIDQREEQQRLHECKLHHLHCIQDGYVVAQSTIRHLLKIHEKKNMKRSHYNVKTIMWSWETTTLFYRKLSCYNLIMSPVLFSRLSAIYFWATNIYGVVHLLMLMFTGDYF